MSSVERLLRRIVAEAKIVSPGGVEIDVAEAPKGPARRERLMVDPFTRGAVDTSLRRGSISYTTTFARALQTEDPVYAARSRLVSAWQAIRAKHRNPVSIVDDYVNSSANLPSQRRTRVPVRVIVDILFTPEVQADLGVTASDISAALNGLNAEGEGSAIFVPRDVARRFAAEVASACLRVAEKEKSEDFDAELETAVSGIMAIAAQKTADDDSLGRVISDIGRALRRQPKEIVRTRVLTEAMDIQPLLAERREASALVRIGYARTAGGVETKEVPTVDPVTGRASKKRTTTVMYRARPRDTVVAAFSAKLLGTPREEITADESAIFDHADAARDRFLKADGLLLVAKAHYLLSRKRDVLDDPKSRIRPEDKVLLEKIFTGIADAVKHHPYGSIVGIDGLVKKAEKSLGLTLKSAGPTDAAAAAAGLPALVLTREQAEAVSKIAATAASAEKVESFKAAVLTSLAGGAGTVDSGILGDIIKVVSRSADEDVGQLIEPLFEALNLEQPVLMIRVEGAEGAAADIAEEVAEVSEAREVSDADNRALREALRIVLDRDVATRAVRDLIRKTEREAQATFAPIDPNKREGVKSQRPPTGEEAIMRLASLVDSTLKDTNYSRFPGDIIAKALMQTSDNPAERGKTLEEVLDDHVGVLRNIRKSAKEEMRSAEQEMDNILDSIGTLTPEAKALRSSLLAAARGGQKITLSRAVFRRTMSARTRDNTDGRAGDIILTAGNIRTGACQLAIDKGMGGDQDIGFDTGTPYATPFGVNSGDVIIRKGEARSMFIERAVATRVQAEYLAYSSRVMMPGSVVAIPCLIGPARRGSDLRSVSTITLGTGVVTNFVNYRYTPKQDDFIRRLGMSRQQYRELGIDRKIGMQINVAGCTIKFAQGQWRVNGIAYDRDLVKNVEAELAGLDQELANARNAKDRKRVEEINERIERARAKKGSTPTANDVIAALRSGTSASYTIEPGTVSLNERTGELTIARIAPTYVAPQRDYISELDMGGWKTVRSTGDDVADVPLEELQRIPTRTVTLGERLGVKSYVPISSLVVNADHADDLDSPFNVNRPPNTPIVYRLGASGRDVTSQVTVLRDSAVDPDETRRKAMSDIKISLDKLLGKRVQLREYEREPFRKRGAIQITVGDADPADVLDLVRSLESVRLSYDVDDVEASNEMYIALRESDRDVASVTMSARGHGTFDLGIGSMVYLSPMYGTMGGSATAGPQSVLDEANLASPPELLGAGRISRLYYDKATDDTQGEQFRALMADISFRGDQVKEGGTRGSVLDPVYVVRGVGVAFIRPLPKAFEIMSPSVRRAGKMADNYPKREGDSFADVGVSTHPLRLAGWTRPSDSDSRRGRRAAMSARSEGGGIRIGSRVRIVQTTHPEVGSTGILRGFRTRDRIDPLQERLLANNRIQLGDVNAIIQVDGGSIVSEFNALLMRARADVVGAPVPKSAILPIFRHIDADITRRYLANPRGAMGYIAAEVGFWDSTQPGTSTRAVLQDDAVRTQLIRLPDGRTATSPIHGAGSWDKMHKQGIAVHPSDSSFARMAGYRQGIQHSVPDVPRSVRLDTINGCVAIAEAIVEHGPEKDFSGDQMHSAEMRRFGTAESFGIASSSDLAMMDPYPIGSHTDQAKYFQHSKPVWMDVAMKSGRGTGATAQFLPKLIRRVGSPVGISFRFQVSEAEGLAYTQLLRDKMETVRERSLAYERLMEEYIANAQRGTINQRRALDLCNKLLARFKSEVTGAITTGISRVNSLGYMDESSNRRVNSAEAYKRALSNFSDWRQTTTQEYDVDPGVLDSLKASLDRVSQIFNPRVGNGEMNIPGSAPVPTDYRLTRVNEEGADVPAYKLTLLSPQPVSVALRSWANVYRRAAFEIAKLEGARITQRLVPLPKRAPTEQILTPGAQAQDTPFLVALVSYILKEMTINPKRIGMPPGPDVALSDPGVASALLRTATLERSRKRIERLSDADATAELQGSIESIARVLAAGEEGGISEDLNRIRNVIMDAATPASFREFNRLLADAKREYNPTGAARVKGGGQGVGAEAELPGAPSYAGMTPEAQDAIRRIERRVDDLARTVADEAMPEDTAGSMSAWPDLISSLPTLREALQTSLSLGISQMISIVKMGETTSERARIAEVAPHIDLEIDTSQIDSARSQFIGEMDRAVSAIVNELKGVEQVLSDSRAPYMQRLTGLVGEVITVINDMLGLLRGASAPDYVIPSRSHLSNSRNYNYSRTPSKYVGITSVTEDTGDLVARRAADIVTNTLTALEPIEAIVTLGKVTARVEGTAVPGGARSDLEREAKAREELENIRTSHERDQFMRIPGFPISDAYIPEKIDEMVQATFSLALDEVVVPIIVPDIEVLGPDETVSPADDREIGERSRAAKEARDTAIQRLTTLRAGGDVPDDAQPLVSAAIEEVP
jgi:hypothetical protein